MLFFFIIIFPFLENSSNWIFFLLIIICRIIELPLLGLSLGLQLFFFFLLKKKGLRKEIVLFRMSIVQEIDCYTEYKVPLMIAPLSGALGLYFLNYIKYNRKELLRCFLLYLINGLSFCSFFQKENATTHFLSLIIISFLIIILIILTKMKIIKSPLSKFGEEFHIFFFEGKKNFFFIIYGIMELQLQALLLLKKKENAFSQIENYSSYPDLLGFQPTSMVWQFGTIILLEYIFIYFNLPTFTNLNLELTKRVKKRITAAFPLPFIIIYQKVSGTFLLN